MYTLLHKDGSYTIQSKKNNLYCDYLMSGWEETMHGSKSSLLDYCEQEEIAITI
jgi:hypothetical protein